MTEFGKDFMAIKPKSPGNKRKENTYKSDFIKTENMCIKGY